MFPRIGSNLLLRIQSQQRITTRSFFKPQMRGRYRTLSHRKASQGGRGYRELCRLHAPRIVRSQLAKWRAAAKSAVVNIIIVKSAPITPRVSRARLKCWDMSSSGTCNGNRTGSGWFQRKSNWFSLRGLYCSQMNRSDRPHWLQREMNPGLPLTRLVSGKHHGFAAASGLSSPAFIR
jgi:hypothetical protein